MANNGNGREVKKCPFLNEWCIGDKCALHIELTSVIVGQLGVPTVKKEGMCAFTGMCAMLSSKGKAPPMGIPPKLIKGTG